jgi:tetratricopeptide (TPR) repeat protein
MIHSQTLTQVNMRNGAIADVEILNGMPIFRGWVKQPNYGPHVSSGITNKPNPRAVSDPALDQVAWRRNVGDTRWGMDQPTESELMEALEAKRDGFDKPQGWATTTLPAGSSFASGKTTRSMRGHRNPSQWERRHDETAGTNRQAKVVYDMLRDGSLTEDLTTGRPMPMAGMTGREKARAKVDQRKHDRTARAQGIDPLVNQARAAHDFAINKSRVYDKKTGQPVTLPNQEQKRLIENLNQLDPQAARKAAERITKAGFGDVLGVDNPALNNPELSKEDKAKLPKTVPYADTSKKTGRDELDTMIKALPEDRQTALKQISPEWKQRVAKRANAPGWRNSKGFDLINPDDPLFGDGDTEIGSYMSDNSDLVPIIQKEMEIRDANRSRTREWNNRWGQASSKTTPPSESNTTPQRGDIPDRWAAPDKKTSPKKEMSLEEQLEKVKREARPETKSYADTMGRMIRGLLKRGNTAEAEKELRELNLKVLDWDQEWKADDRWSDFRREMPQKINNLTGQSDMTSIHPSTKVVLDNSLMHLREALNHSKRTTGYQAREKLMRNVNDRWSESQSLITEDSARYEIDKSIDEMLAETTEAMKFFESLGVDSEKGDQIRQQLLSSTNNAKALMDSGQYEKAQPILEEVMRQIKDFSSFTTNALKTKK